MIDGPARIKRCLHCNQDSIVLYSRPMGVTEICTLDCSHVCAYTREGGDMRDGTGGTDMQCPVCKRQFRTYIQGSYGKICVECKGDFGIRNSVEAEQMLQILDEVGDSGLKNLIEKRQETGQMVIPPLRSVPPRMDDAKLREIARAMTDYGVLVPLPESLPKPTTYAIAKNGLFEVRDNDVARIVFQPKEVLGLSETLTPGVTLNVPKVPYEMLQQTVAFFRETCVKQKGSSEALVQIWWNRVEKRYMVHVPEQNVSGGGVNHRSEFDKENARDSSGASIWLHVMDIHSHGSGMSAFWSGTDDSDERKAPEGRMFGVIGKVQQPLPEWRWRMRTREGFIELKVTDVFEVTTGDAVPFTVTWGVILDAATDKDGISADGRVKLLCPVDPFKDTTCPPEWQEKVKGTSWSGGNQMGFMRTGYGGGHSMPMYIYIETSDGMLEEFSVSANDREPPKPTGKKVVWKRGQDNVH